MHRVIPLLCLLLVAAPPARAREAAIDRSKPVVCSAHRAGLPDGTPGFRLGYDHGTRLAAEIRDLLRVAEPALVAQAAKRGLAKNQVVPLLVRAAKSVEPRIPTEYVAEMRGIAQGAGVPYDRILLINTFLTIAEQTDPAALLKLPVRCTNVVAFGEATCMGQMLHASTLDWGLGAVLRGRARVIVFEPAQGAAFVSIGWPGMVGTLRAMSTHGVVVTEESCAAPLDTRLDGTPLPLVLRDAIQYGAHLEDAVARVRSARGTCGYKITISDGPCMDARTIAVTATRHHVRKPANGLLFGVEPGASGDRFEGGKADPEIPRSDASSRLRYEALRKLIRPGHQCLRRSLVSWALAQQPITNDNTLLACVFEPLQLRLHVALGDDVDPDDTAAPLRWTTHHLATLLGDAWRTRHDPLRQSPPIEATWKDLTPLFGIRRSEIAFASPRPSHRAFNDQVHAELWRPEEEPKGVVIHLPAWKERTLAAHRFLAANLARRGIAAVILPLPYQHGRTAPGERPGQRTLSANLAETRNAMVQGLSEVRALAEHLRDKLGRPLAVSGVSLGGHVAAVAYGRFPDLFAGGAFVLAGGNVIEAFLLPNSVTGRIQKELARRGVTLAEAREMAREFEPLRYADPKRGKGIVIVAADEDDVVAPRRAKALAKAYGDAKIVWLDGGHYAPVRPDQAARLVKAVGEHLANVFGGQ